MERTFLIELNEWKNSKRRKPLIIQGARQVGKTFAAKEFGKKYFENTVYINFEQSELMKDVFKQDYNIERIITACEIETGITINAKNTLLIFDEIQEAERGLTALKYFFENAPQYYVIAAGSLLGVAMQKKHSFPVGKIDFLKLHPFSFYEFLISINQKKLAEILEKNDAKQINTFHDYFTQYLRLYYFVGGMPEAIVTYINTNDLNEVRKVQKNILLGYELDFSKYAHPSLVPRLRLVWNNILNQLAKENKKFVYNQLKVGGRAKEFDLAICWLTDAGLLNKVIHVTKPTAPLSAYADFDTFKLYALDVGLLGAMANLDAKILLNKNTILTEFKGALTEQYVNQQLRMTKELYYWTNDKATAEVDFVIQHGDEIYPVEVKAEENLQSKSLKVYAEKYKPKKVFRVSLSAYRKEKTFTNLPLFAVNLLA
ncbi:MAG: ATP-binding protein [Bacteroidia bacterium]